MRHPGKVAMGGTAWQPTFAELDAAANGVADAVLDRRSGSGPVALLLRHDAPLVAALLGALKAGKTAVTLNPADPPARLERIRADVGPQLVLCDEVHRELALRAGYSPAELITIADPPDATPHPAPDVAISPRDVAFLIYTSGSTGRPKGVIQTHRNMLHNVLRQTNGLGIGAEDRIIQLASVSGAQGLATTWVGLLNGGTLCPFPIMERGVTGLPGWLEENRITVFVASSSVFRNFVRTLDGEELSTIRLVRLGSEPAARADFDAYRRHFEPACLFANMYSSSEAGNITQCLLTADADPPDGGLPVGRPAEGVEVLLLDEDGGEAPPGRTGEVVVRSEYLSPGYWGDGALTAERYSPAAPEGSERLFRTGDLGRRSDDGVLSVVGRSDAQIKVRGNRVELSEVEAAIAALPEVAGAAVCPGTTPRGDMQLTAYVTIGPGSAPTAGSLRAKLRSTLPDHSVPAAFVFLDALPLGPQGKVDRSRLARLERASPAPEIAEPPASGTEEALVALWSEAFDLERVGPRDDFFDLGGDSLLAAVIAAEAHSAFGVEIELGAFMDHPTVREMAKLVDRLRSRPPDAVRPPLERASRAEPLPASFDQERLWQSRAAPGFEGISTMAVAARIQGPLDVPTLRRTLDHLVRRHEMLRTTFTERDGRLTQIVHPAEPVDIPLIDLRDAPDPDAQTDELLRREARMPFDLEQGPLLRLRLLRIRDDEHRLLRVSHHIMSDALSWKIFFEELAELYGAHRRGEPPPLADEQPLQYGDFAAWERRYLRPESRRYREELAWWRHTLEDASAPALLPFSRRSIVWDAAPSDGQISWKPRPELSRELDRLGRQEGATHYMMLLALFGAQLAVEGDRDDIVLITDVTKRRLPELQRMFGCLMNPAILRLRFEREATFRHWLGRVRTAVAETSAHSEIPIKQLLEELNADGIQPAIVGTFAESVAVPPLRSGGIEIGHLPSRAIEHTYPGFSLWVSQVLEVDRCAAVFDARVYDPAEVNSFLERLQRLAAEACAHPDRSLREMIHGG